MLFSIMHASSIHFYLCNVWKKKIINCYLGWHSSWSRTIHTSAWKDRTWRQKWERHSGACTMGSIFHGSDKRSPNSEVSPSRSWSSHKTKGIYSYILIHILECINVVDSKLTSSLSIREISIHIKGYRWVVVFFLIYIHFF